MIINSVILVSKKKNDDFINENSLDEYIFKSLYMEDLKKKELKAETELTEVVFSLSEEKIDDLRSSRVKIPEEEKSYGGVILKELPKNLKFVFLDEENSKPVIIAANLTTGNEEKLK